MKLFSFRGGIHPYDGKAMSKDLPIAEAKAGKELVYPLQQHIGAMAKPVVSKGDRVLVGQKIARAGLCLFLDLCDSFRKCPHY